MNKIQLENAYSYCRRVTQDHAKSFYFSAKFLPKEKQKPIYALYALCRYVDDEIDERENISETESVEIIAGFRKKLNSVYEFQESNNEILPDNPQSQILLAWQDLLQKYKIPQDLPVELMKGVLMDVQIKRYETFDELYVYCYRVASTVGLMASEIFGYVGGDETLLYAEKLGIAMQLTNILRDINEDAAMGRIYLPQEDLRRFNVSEQQIFDKTIDENFINLMKYEIARARNYYESSKKGIPFLSKNTRFTVLLALRIYSRILDEIEKQNYDIFKKRASTSKFQKISLIPKIWLEARKM